MAKSTSRLAAVWILVISELQFRGHIPLEDSLALAIYNSRCIYGGWAHIFPTSTLDPAEAQNLGGPYG